MLQACLYLHKKDYLEIMSELIVACVLIIKILVLKCVNINIYEY